MQPDKETKRLIDGFQVGSLSQDEIQQLERLIESGKISLSDFSELEKLHSSLFSADLKEPSAAMNARFYTMLASHKTKVSWVSRFYDLWYAKPLVRWGYSFFLIVIGVVAGLLWMPGDYNSSEMNQLSAEVKEMKEMMMLSLLEEESINDRLKAVSLSYELPDASEKITSALLKTLNNDENVNVRLGALEALAPYVDNAQVRMGLISSIAKQESPLVQMGLAEMMLALHEKRSVEALKGLLKKQHTPDEVKEKINETLKILI